MYIISENSNNNIGDEMKYLTKSYEINRDIFKSDFKDCSDFLLREVIVSGRKAFFCTFDGLTDSLMLSHMITNPILKSDVESISPAEHFETIKKCIVGSVEMNEVNTFENANSIL